MDYFSVGATTVIGSNQNLTKFRDWFRSAVDKSNDWRKEAREDYSFVTGQGQWSKADKEALAEQGRPAITINKIKPQINVLSGYQRLNRYDIDFLPRTPDDQKLCDVRKGVTKFIMDECDYEYNESQVFIDGAISGIGWFEVRYDWDYDTMDGEVKIIRESPFNIYVDPEARKIDFSDAKFIIRAKWVDKEELKLIYKEHAEEIQAQTDLYDREEQEYASLEPLWYQKDTKKLRLVECWYKERKRETFYLLADGSKIPKKEFKIEMLANGSIIKPITIPVDKVRVCVFFGEIELEHVNSPYDHGEIPFVPFVTYYYGENDTPAGVVRDLKDPQREINKRRSQSMHVLNTQSNSGWMKEEGAMTPEQENNVRNIGAMPGAIITVAPGALTGGRVQRIQPSNPPNNLLQAVAEAEQDIPSISGINEALMGTDMAASSSGRAIELKQKQAVTQIAPLFDNLRKAKKKITYLLWGKRGRKGLIPQYYTDAKCYRIVGTNGQQQFINVNQPAVVNDPIKGVIQTTLNDLSQGEFDIVIADTPATATQRISQFWSLVDAVSKLGIPGDMVFDILLDLSDVPSKDEIKQRWTQRQEQQQQQVAQAQQAMPKINETVNYKDLPLPIQLQLAAKANLLPQQVADEVLKKFMDMYLPHLAQGEQQGNLPPEMQQQMLMQQQAQQLQTMQGQGGESLTPQPQQMTQAAMQSLIAGQAPATM